jgi:ketosteroid isomerase-like protein
MSAPTGLAAAVAAFCEAWSRRDAAGVLSLWDGDDPKATYLPASASAPLVGAAAIRAYVEGECAAFGLIVFRPDVLHLRALGGGLGLAFFRLAWAVRESPARAPFGDSVRVTMLLRETAAGWRIFHYAEAPLAPLLALQHFYQRIAADGLDAIPRRGAP